jgi:hypothetical protein
LGVRYKELSDPQEYSLIMKKLRYSILLLLIILLSSTTYGQVYNKQDKKFRHWQKAQRFKKKYRYWMIGASVGTTTYKGDLNPDSHVFSTKISSSRLNLGAHLIWRYAPRVNFRTSLSYGRITGDDAENASPGTPRYNRNLSFVNDIYEFKVGVIIDYFQNRKTMRRRMNWTPYGFLSIGAIYHTPKARYEGNTYNLRKLGTAGQNLDGGKGAYSSIGMVVPFGVGIRYKINNAFDISFEFGARLTFTDYLDDVGDKYYVDKERLGGPTDIAVILSDRSPERDGATVTVDGKGYSRVNGYGNSGELRGDPKNKDWYFVTGFHLTYIFHPKTVAARYKG